MVIWQQLGNIFDAVWRVVVIFQKCLVGVEVAGCPPCEGNK